MAEITLEERRKIVKKFYNKGRRGEALTKKVNEELGTNFSKRLIMGDITYLRKKGELDEKSDMRKKEEVIKKIYGDDGLTGEELRKATNEELERELGIILSMTAIEKIQKKLKDRGEVSDEKSKQRREEIQQRIRGEKLDEIEKLTKDKKTIDQIAEKTGMHRDTVIEYRKILREQGRLTGKEKSKRQETKVDEDLDETEKMVKAGKTRKEIGKKIGRHESRVAEYKRILREQGKLTGKEKSKGQATYKKEKRMERVDKLLTSDEELTEVQIAEKEGVSKQTIAKDKVRLREQKEQEFAEWSKEIIKRYEKFYGQSASIKRFEQYLTLCKERYEQTLIEEEHLLPIKYAAIATETYSNIAFYIKLCIRFNQFEEAMKFAKSYVSCETFSQEERGKIKKSLTECEKFCQAIRMINNPAISDETIRQVTGLSKVEIALLRKKAEKRANGDSEIKTKEEAPEVRKHEENNDGDELERA